MYGVPVALEGDRPAAYRLVTVEMYRSLFGSLFGERRMPVYAVFLMILAAISLLTYRLHRPEGQCMADLTRSAYEAEAPMPGPSRARWALRRMRLRGRACSGRVAAHPRRGLYLASR